jgi:hypothetical protein
MKMKDSVQCDKAAYKSEAEAHKVRQSVYKQRKRQIRIYKCDDCFMWHLTSLIDDFLDTHAFNQKQRQKYI